MRIERAGQLDAVDFTKHNGLVPVVTQHALTGEVLMLAFANRDALERTITDQAMWYWSRRRGALWRKGETSGNEQRLVSLHTDCDSDAIVARVLPHGPACHTGAWSCFDAAPTLAALDAIIAARALSSREGSYTERLLADANLRLKKLGEEAIELALACERNDALRVREEAADLIYHVLVACRAAGVDAAAVLGALEARRGISAADAAPGRAGTAAAE
ncbi:MAG TPA: bifunctional phosphoribosyl-AMP cyclohydrolase/phosphoribosyl-ATP diphosphatase HisIE [Longimicrobiales bacterium]|nr:bifunctional phosphoribosyl-AMP cyclohydrolase/phosphoribosyl-ATP diphosphatase HisIE [Longimicrobiales bacterium]